MDDFGQLSPFIKVDLHIHTIESQYKDKGIVDQSDEEHLDVILSALNKYNINLFSFADHNRFNEGIYNKAVEILESDEGHSKYPNLMNILPSVEFDVQIDSKKNPCHILTVFDAKDKSERRKIREAIEKDKLIKREEYYELDRFVALLKEIGLSTILIASQRKALENRSPDTQSNISDSCEDVVEFLKTGFISALEYQKPNVEGILNNSLSDFDESVKPALVADSDCHEWSAYPYHDSKNKQASKSWCFEIKSQPTFLGLLMAVTSPQTRFKREKSSIPYIKSFEFNGQRHLLSPGFNAIIGENGSGKSTLLSLISPTISDSKEQYIQKIKKDNKISVERDGDYSSLVKYIKQGDLVNQSKKNNLFINDVSCPGVDNSTFKQSVENYSRLLLEKVHNNIDLKDKMQELSDEIFTLNENQECATSYFVSIVLSADFANSNNPFKELLESTQKIVKSIVDLRKKITDSEESAHIDSALASMKELERIYTQKFRAKEYENHVKNVIANKVNNYNGKLKEMASSKDAQTASYKQEKQRFIDKIVQMARLECEKEQIVLPDKIEKGKGTEELLKQGFKFLTTAKYDSIADIKKEFLSDVFNKDYHAEDKILKIDNIDKLKEAIKGCGESNQYKEKMEDNTQKFIARNSEEEHSITEVDGSSKAGGTLGEQSLAYYKFITHTDAKEKIFLIDQPEDNISVPGILKKLISYLNQIRDKKQIIFVTHHPLLVVNLDVDNVIYLKKGPDGIDCVSGCLEREGILNKIEENLDGGKEALKKRLKVYE